MLAIYGPGQLSLDYLLGRQVLRTSSRQAASIAI
jgi:hypothetical protein